jgi:hypothetical protein
LVRVPAALRIELTFPNGSVGIYFSHDFGANGALLKRADDDATIPPKGSYAQCSFHLGELEIRSRATVTRTSDADFAIRFVGMPHPLEDKIVGWVFRQDALRHSTHRRRTTRRRP